MKTLDDNNKNWQKLDIVLRKRQKSTVIWITCDNYPYRQALIKEFINRFNEFEHIKLSLAEFGEKSFIDFFKENLPAQAFDGGKYVVHLTDIETVLLPHLKAEKSKEHFLVMLNFEREILFSFPFFIVFWSTTYAQIAVQQLATDFWDWLTYKFHFTAPEQISQKPELQQIEYKEFIPEEEKGRIYDRIQHNLYALKTIEKERISDRLTLFKSIISDYLKLNEPEKAKLVFEEAIKLKNIPPEQQAELYLLGAEILNELGDYDKAIHLATKTINLYEQNLGKKYSNMAKAYDTIAISYKIIGDLDKALEYEKKALKLKSYLNEYEVANLYNNISSIYWQKGELNKALEFALKSLEKFKKIFPKDYPEIATLYNNIGTIYWQKNETDKAIEFLLKANDLFFKTIGEKNLDLATTYNNIAILYYERGEFDKAIEFANKALNIKEQILNKNNPSIATSYNNIARIYYTKGEKEKAWNYISKALKIWKKSLPPTHPQLKKAEAFYEQLTKELGKENNQPEKDK